MSHEQFTRGDLAFNRVVTLFCRRDMSPQFKLIWIQGTCRGDKISSPQQDFSWKSSVHTMGFVAGTKSPRHVPATCPLAWADLYGYKRARHCGITANGRNQANGDFSWVRNVNWCFARCAANKGIKRRQQTTSRNTMRRAYEDKEFDKQIREETDERGRHANTDTHRTSDQRRRDGMMFESAPEEGEKKRRTRGTSQQQNGGTSLTLSLPRVIKFKCPLQPHQ